MKKNIIIISKDFYPNSNGTILCLENILPFLSARYNIKIYTKKTAYDSAEKDIHEGSTLIRPHSWIDCVVLQKHSIVKILNNMNIIPVITMMFRILLYPFTILSKQYGYILDIGWQKNIANYIHRSEQYGSIDAILAVGAPFENFKAACKLKSFTKNARLILMQFDHYAENPELQSKGQLGISIYESRLAEEKIWYKISDKILVTKEMYATVIRNHPSFSNKIISVGMPSLYNIKDYNPVQILKKNSNTSIDIVYTGLFYKDIRNPHYALEVLSRVIAMDHHVRLHVFGYGCEDIIKAYKKKMGENLFIYGHQSKQNAINARYSADILLNVSNNVNTQAPSKILEYIGSCKPIVNFYSIYDDLCVGYLKKHPISLSIYEDESRINENAELLHKFILENKNFKCDINQIMSDYKEYQPSSYAEKIIEAVQEISNHEQVQ